MVRSCITVSVPRWISSSWFRRLFKIDLEVKAPPWHIVVKSPVRIVVYVFKLWDPAVLLAQHFVKVVLPAPMLPATAICFGFFAFAIYDFLNYF